MHPTSTRTKDYFRDTNVSFLCSKNARSLNCLVNIDPGKEQAGRAVQLTIQLKTLCKKTAFPRPY